MSAVFLVGATVIASAQPQYQAIPNNQAQPNPYNQVPAAPPSWYYNPYTSGLGPCPQRYPADPPCRDTIDPSYGQPSYWRR
jgi:hypothetical protein